MSTEKKNNPIPPEVKVTGISSARKLLVIAIIVALIIGIVYWFLDKKESEESASGPDTTVAEPQFSKEGSLFFLNQDSQDTLSRIAIEVAGSEEERAQGLMYRSHMADSVGMLFIFENAAPRSFWMKNTKIPLDIIYVGDDKEIVMLYKGVMPYSTQSIPSYKDARYVVEVNAGFTTEHNIKEGDHIDFEIMQ